MFAVLDFASQYSQLIVRRLRDLGHYAELYPYNVPLSTLEALSPKGIILSGGPFSLEGEQAPQREVEPLHRLAPILGICYGMQMIAHQKGGHLVTGTRREYGLNTIYWEEPFWEKGWQTHSSKDLKSLKDPKGLKDPKNLKSLKSFKIPKEQKVWMSHGDTLEKPPPGIQVCAHSQNGHCAAFYGERLLAFQFHPEVTHTEKGSALLNYFAQNLCGSSPQWSKESIFERAKQQLLQQMKGDFKGGDFKGGFKKKKILCALSGGVDSSVLALFLSRVLGTEPLHCVFMDTGLLRKGEYEEVLRAYKSLGLKVQGIDGRQTFLQALKGIVDPEEKRKIIGRTFIELFERETQKQPQAIDYFAQGTLYPDVIESHSPHALSKVTIKSHHNVGGLPDKMPWKLVEPFCRLFKDEVRQLGEYLHLPSRLLHRHPFPGPGLAVRILGEVTEEKLHILRECDKLFIQALRDHGVYSEIWQALCVLLPISSVGVQGDTRSYGHVLALRCVVSTDGMTADWYPFNMDLLQHISNLITNKVPAINRVVYDITSKPPATIEWE